MVMKKFGGECVQQKHIETFPNVDVASTTWTLTDASPRPAAMLLREKFGAEMV
jgi:hypothetical protein